jgi:hypothetical protein
MLPRRVYLHHVSHYVPETVLDNRFLEGIIDTTDAGSAAGSASPSVA